MCLWTDYNVTAPLHFPKRQDDSLSDDCLANRIELLSEFDLMAEFYAEFANSDAVTG